MPEWYEVIVAAKYLGVPPWELVERPLFWKQIALQAQSAEAGAKSNKRAMEERRKG